MTARFKNETFSGFKDSDSSGTYEDLHFEQCSFSNVSISRIRAPSFRSTIRRADFLNCHAGPGTWIGAPLLEDVVIEGLTTSQRLDSHGAAFHRVVLRGSIGAMMLSDFVPAAEREEQRRSTAAFEESNAAIYESIQDFALDISQATFTDTFDIRSVIPAHLIRRNPETQFLVTRNRAEDRKFQELDFGMTGWDLCIGRMLRGSGDSVVLSVDSRARLAGDYARSIALLHQYGLTEPDDAGATI